MKKAGAFYLLSLLALGAGIGAALYFGQRLEAGRGISAPAAPHADVSIEKRPSGLAANWFGNLSEPFSILLLQIIVIVFTARLLGGLFFRMGQPGVLGEIIAGIILGPSLLGQLAPDAFNFLFAPSSLHVLQLLSNIGVLLFMFVIGMEVDMREMRKRAGAAILISHVSIVFPCFLGVVLALALYGDFAPPQTSFQAFGLFMGVAMSLTAFPVLARILRGKRMAATPLGQMALTCAAVGDVTAWSVLAVIVAIVRAGAISSAGATIILVAVFSALMILVARPVLARVVGTMTPERPKLRVMAAVLLCMFVSGLITQTMGVHALFGAFLAGAIVPNDPILRKHLRQSLESVSSGFLLPLFFAFTGLHTSIGLLNGAVAWAVCALVIALATLGKLGGSAVAARVTGMDWHESFKLGALMNTRGLVELVVLNIGYDLGILTPLMFTIMVLMALVTTMMTGPLLSLAGRWWRTTDTAVPIESEGQAEKQRGYEPALYAEQGS